jgi:hypothetical protein
LRLSGHNKFISHRNARLPIKRAESAAKCHASGLVPIRLMPAA